MTDLKGNTKVNNQDTHEEREENQNLVTMEKGYKEMAYINLALAKLCFELEREVESYYDCVAESE